MDGFYHDGDEPSDSITKNLCINCSKKTLYDWSAHIPIVNTIPAKFNVCKLLCKLKPLLFMHKNKNEAKLTNALIFMFAFAYTWATYRFLRATGLQIWQVLYNERQHAWSGSYGLLLSLRRQWMDRIREETDCHQLFVSSNGTVPTAKFMQCWEWQDGFCEIQQDRKEASPLSPRNEASSGCGYRRQPPDMERKV
jgi:hypothetical protein